MMDYEAAVNYPRHDRRNNYGANRREEPEPDLVPSVDCSLLIS